MKKEETPIHEHDCDNCVFLGNWVSRFYEPGVETDLYFCSGGIGGWTVICRFGELGDYASGAVFSGSCEDLSEAGKRAVEKGLITQADIDKACAR